MSLKDSLKGAIFGIVLVIAGCLLLFWNEGRAVRRAKTLEEGEKSVVEAPADSPSPELNGKLVHVVGELKGHVLQDPDLLVVVKDALKLSRDVEMYQWEEEEKTEVRKVGDKKIKKKRYIYRKTWSSEHIDSSRFHSPEGHQNPPMPLSSASWEASRATVGMLELDRSLWARVPCRRKVPPEGVSIERVEKLVGGRKAEIKDDLIYVGNPNSPEVGDLRIEYTAVGPCTISIVAGLQGVRLVPFKAKHGKLALVAAGAKDASQMFGAAKSTNRLVTWLVRLGGILLLIIGFRVSMSPLVAVFGSVPVAGGVAKAGFGILSLFLGASLGTLIISLGWLFYRPLVGVPLLAVSLVFFVAAVRSRKRYRQPKSVPPPPPPPPPAV